MDETFILNELKSLILSKTGIRTITPADCKRISIEISKTLNKNVSETTIKRLFGFAMVKHNFSKFTLTTLSEYVNEEHLEQGSPNKGLNIQNSPRTWKEIHEKAIKVSEYTVKAIKNRSGIPYEMTISRKFSEHDFELFFKSDYSFTSYISQPGYGKSILLTHLAEKLISNERNIFSDSSLLFITTSSLFNGEKGLVNFEEQLKFHLGIPAKDSLIAQAAQNYDTTGGKLIIFIDGFSDHEFEKDLKKQLFESITNFLCTIENCKAIKLVLSMRSTTWIRFYNEIRHSAYLKSKWFPGSYFNVAEISNVPPLTEKEVDQILSKINSKEHPEIGPNLKDQLKFPFHIQLYHQLKKEDPNFNYSTNITFYELIFKFIQNQIYRSNYYTEKILFLKKIILLTDFGRNGSSILKDDLIGDLLAFKNAYIELLSDGILMEEKSNEDFHPKEYVKFIHPHIFEYFLFIEILEKFDLKVDGSYFDFIQKEYKSEQIRFQLLQWTIRFIIRIGDFKSLALLFELDLNNYEKNYLILFVAENLHYRCKNNPDTNRLLHEHKFHEAIVKELISFDFIDSFYRDAINVLIEITEDEETLMVYHAILSIFDVFSLNTDLIKKRTNILYSFDSKKWPVHPQKINQLILDRINGKTDNKIAMQELIKACSESYSGVYSIQQTVSLILIIVLGFFYKYNDADVKNIRSLYNHTALESQPRSQLAIFLVSLLALANLIQGNNTRIFQFGNILSLLGKDKMRFGVTKYTEATTKLINAQLNFLEKEYAVSYQYYLDCLQIFKRNKLNLHCTYIYSTIIEIFKKMNDHTRANEFKYDMLCFIEDNNISGKFNNWERNNDIN